MLLKEGATPTSVVTGLDDMIGRLQRVAGGSNWSAARDAYLVVLEAVDPSLRSWFEDDDGAGVGMHGDHYKLIREMSGYTARPLPLIDDEIGRQVRVLEALKADVRALESLRARPGRLVVLDTNTLMHFHRPDGIPWTDVVGSDGQVRIILPICVLDELDNKKYTGSDRMARRAQNALKVLRGYKANFSPGISVASGNGHFYYLLAWMSCSMPHRCTTRIICTSSLRPVASVKLLCTGLTSLAQISQVRLPRSWPGGCWTCSLA